ncbi:MAG: hypothetical protein M1570_04615 [Chloroflexi bacterium]|nr:hypothetical protein [Chloroflexota bacterium]
MSAKEEITSLEKELEQLQSQLPRHSISPSIQARIDELEETIAELKEKANAPQRGNSLDS